MFCQNCTKLVLLHTKKTCIKCHGEVLINICVLCESCSNTDKKCAVCLKKTDSSFAKKLSTYGCNACRSKQR